MKGSGEQRIPLNEIRGEDPTRVAAARYAAYAALLLSEVRPKQSPVAIEGEQK